MAVESFTNDPLIVNLAIFIIALPIVTGIILNLLRALELKRGKNLPESFSGYFGVFGLLGSFVASFWLLVAYFSKYVTLGENASITAVKGSTPFLSSSGLSFSYGVLIDPTSVIFMVVLTTIASLIHLYAVGYMHEEPAYTRFFGTLNFFTGSMLGFVLASNMFLGFIFWEFLGFSSYLLIGYYWPKPSAAHAAKKAFLYNKIGDVSFMIGMAILYAQTIQAGNATLDYLQLKAMVSSGQLPFADLLLPSLFIFGAAVGKSAQFPLFGWLPEAMEGPTPVSALLHSSTMVKAGLFLLARTFFLYYNGLDTAHILSVAPTVITWAGTLTAFMGGCIALTATDIKKVLAFSTISQLGYIGMAIGAGGVTAGYMHIISHATFKSLLFLCAGSVIHAVHSQEYRDMGGLRKHMKWTHFTMLTGLLGLSGFFGMSGFWSKDAVLGAVKNSGEVYGGVFAYWLGVITAAITAFYSAKMLVLTFWGEPRYDEKHVHPHEPSWQMLTALIVLAALVWIESIWWALGTFMPESTLNFHHYLAGMLGGYSAEFEWSGAAVSTVFVLIGIALAFSMYWARMPGYNVMKSVPSNPVVVSLSKIVKARFGLDLLLYWIAEHPAMVISEWLSNLDLKVIDGIINGTASAAVKVADGAEWTDHNVVDGTVRGAESSADIFSNLIKRLQKGQTGLYARLMAAGMAAILLGLLFINLKTFFNF